MSILQITKNCQGLISFNFKNDTPVMDIQFNLGRYKTVKVLGEGRYATVYEGEVLDKKDSAVRKEEKENLVNEIEKVAIKVTSKLLIKKTNPEFIQNELRAYRKIEAQKKYCENIVKFIDFYEIEDNAFFILEYINGYTLQRVIYESFQANKKVTDQEKKGYLMQIGRGLQYLHNPVPAQSRGIPRRPQAGEHSGLQRKDKNMRLRLFNTKQ